VLLCKLILTLLHIGMNLVFFLVIPANAGIQYFVLLCHSSHNRVPVQESSICIIPLLVEGWLAHGQTGCLFAFVETHDYASPTNSVWAIHELPIQDCHSSHYCVLDTESSLLSLAGGGVSLWLTEVVLFILKTAFSYIFQLIIHNS
jgi:hypothetical protein